MVSRWLIPKAISPASIDAVVKNDIRKYSGRQEWPWPRMDRAWQEYPRAEKHARNGSQTSAQPKPPCIKRIGLTKRVPGPSLFGLAERSSRGPQGLSMKERVILSGRGLLGGGTDLQDSGQRSLVEDVAMMIG
jgi:hypothetical protein